MAESVQAHVEKWLRTSGAALELRTLAAFRRNGIDAEPSKHYTVYVPDAPSTTREIDVVAAARRDLSHNGDQVAVHLAIECKSSTAAPWVVFEQDTRLGLAAVGSLLPMVEVRVQTPSSATRLSVESTGLEPLLELGAIGWHAHRVAVAQDSSRRDEAFDAVRQVLSSAEGVVAGLPSAYQRTIANVVIPVLMLSAQIFRASVTEAGEAVVSEVQRALLVTRSTGSTRPRAIWIMNESELETLPRELTATASRLEIREVREA